MSLRSVCVYFIYLVWTLTSLNTGSAAKVLGLDEGTHEGLNDFESDMLYRKEKNGAEALVVFGLRVSLVFLMSLTAQP
jgi:hypothetical protein